MSTLVLVLVLSAAVAHAAWNIVAHRVSGLGLPFLWWGAVASTVLWAPVVPFTGGIGSGPDALRGLLIGAGVSGVLHVGYMVVLQHGYARGRLSTVYATARGTGPALSAGLAVLLLGERIPPLAVLGVAVVVAGVIATGLLDRPPGSEPTHRRGIDPSILFGVLTGVAIAVYTIWDAHALRTWGLSPVAFMVGCTLLEIGLYLVPLRGRRAELRAVLVQHWPRVLAFGALSPLSYILVLQAITLAPVALVAPLREVSVVLVSVFGALVLREGSAVRRIAASLVVVAGIVLLSS
ncbi:EamA family transporter [Rathayibacter sp. VKM Ac-2760]|uniref:EamA family transporter n=1 Tax=Rathayibacter sp. VKM Ac-2760 TaxID=2609253 RepID=UPI0013160E93|nr:EamA family transporter [Rathayibacter sp. VKM Ac-2760]QHC58874.1 EamA family transporter [Rathayibacter sp. VKM Ac-2760]